MNRYSCCSLRVTFKLSIFCVVLRSVCSQSVCCMGSNVRILFASFHAMCTVCSNGKWIFVCVCVCVYVLDAKKEGSVWVGVHAPAPATTWYRMLATGDIQCHQFYGLVDTTRNGYYHLKFLVDRSRGWNCANQTTFGYLFTSCVDVEVQ